MEHSLIKAIEMIPEPFAGSAVKRTSQADQGFSELLKNAVESVNSLQHAAGRLEDAVAKGEDVSIHQAVIAGEKAGLSFRLLMQVRNKMIDSYQEVMRMQV